MIKSFSFLNLYLILFLSFILFSCGTKPVKDMSGLEDGTAKEKPTDTKPVSSADISPNSESPQKQNGLFSFLLGKTSGQDELGQAIAADDDEKIRSLSLELLQINSKNFRALNSLAMYHYKKRQYEAALLLLNKALVINPKSSEVYNNYGLIELAKNEKREAIIMLRKALELNPRNYHAAVNVASIYAVEKDYNKVIFSLENFVNNQKIDANSLNNYAIALAATDKIEMAAKAYEKILDNNPDNRNVMLNYSILMIEKQGKYREGLDLINRLKFVGTDNESRQVIKGLENKAKAGLK